MTTQLSDMRSRIADDLNRSDLSSQIDKAINRAIIHYQSEPFWFKETSGTFSTVASQASYATTDVSPIPSDIDRIHYMEANVNNGQYEVDPRDIKWIRIQNPQLAIGIPTHFAWWNKKIWFYLVPNAVYTVTIYYTKTYAVLSANSDTNDWLTYAEDLIESRAKAWLYARILKDTNNAALSQAEEQQALQSLREVNEGYTSQSRILPSRF